MFGTMDYEAAIREGQAHGVGGDRGDGFAMLRLGGGERFDGFGVGRAFYREALGGGRQTKEDALREAREKHPEVLWELGRRETGHLLVAGTGSSLGEDGADELAAFGRALVARALKPEGVWHVCWVSEGADVGAASLAAGEAEGAIYTPSGASNVVGRAGRPYLLKLGEDFTGAVAWDQRSAGGLLGALTRAAGDEKLPRRKNTLVIVERPRSHEVLEGVEGLLRASRGAPHGRLFGAGVHVMLLTESPGSLPSRLMRLLGQRLAFPVTRAASRDVLDGSEDAATLRGIGTFDGESLPYAPAVLYDRERGGRDVFVPCVPQDTFEGGMERLSYRRGGTRSGPVVGEGAGE